MSSDTLLDRVATALMMLYNDIPYPDTKNPNPEKARAAIAEYRKFKESTTPLSRVPDGWWVAESTAGKLNLWPLNESHLALLSAAPAPEAVKSYCGKPIPLRYGSSFCGNPRGMSPDVCDECESKSAHPAPPPAEPGHKNWMNGCPQPCDVPNGEGPCCCGAWHDKPGDGQREGVSADGDICPNCERITSIYHCQVCGADFERKS